MSDEFGEIELRCPVNNRKLLGKLVTQEIRPRVAAGNLIEIDCRWCSHDRGVKNVLHRWNPLGEHVEDVVIEGSQPNGRPRATMNDEQPLRGAQPSVR